MPAEPSPRRLRELYEHHVPYVRLVVGYNQLHHVQRKGEDCLSAYRTRLDSDHFATHRRKTSMIPVISIAEVGGQPGIACGENRTPRITSGR